MNSVLPWLSVVIPVYQGEAWIATALESLAAQEIDGVEILLVDGGPGTATVDIGHSFSDRLPLQIFQKPSLTSWQAKTNFAVHAATAAHICFLGVDDVWLPGRAKAVRAWVQAAPHVSLHLAASVLIDHDGRHLGRWRCPFPSNEVLHALLVCERLLVQNSIAAPAPVFRRDAYLRCGGLDEDLWYSADWDLWLKMAWEGPVLYHSAPTVGFRVHGGSLTVTGSRDAADFERQMHLVLERHLGRASTSSPSVARTAGVSITVNAALAAASSGDWRGLPRAASAVFRLGPAGIGRYFRDSRILERTLPRIRAKLNGSL